MVNFRSMLFPRPSTQEYTDMRKLLVIAAAIACLATTPAFAQGKPGGVGGGPPAGAGPGGSPGGAHMGGMGGGMSGSAGGMARGGGFQDQAMTRREAAIERRDRMPPEQAVFGLSTSERAKLLKDADLAARKAFGEYQAALAKLNGRSAREARRNAKAATPAEVENFGRDTATRARELQSADAATRAAFGKLQAALARAEALQRAAAGAAAKSEPGRDTAARAQALGSASVDTKKGFGAAQSARAREKQAADN